MCIHACDFLSNMCPVKPIKHNKMTRGYIMQIVGLHEAQAGIKIARRNISNLIYADDGETLWTTVHEVTKSQTQLSNGHRQLTPPLWQKVKRNYGAS